VYGGGGIIPDYFIPMDTLKYSHSVNRLYYGGALNTFAFEYTDHHRLELLNKYKNAAAFISNYHVGNPEITALKSYLQTKKINVSTFVGIEKGFDQLLKALIGRNLYDKDAYYPIMNQNDNAILKAIELLAKTKNL
jgi:carboxyl-terminal processing protease